MQCKIILIGMLLVCVSPVMAWDEESGYAEGEYVDIEQVTGWAEYCERHHTHGGVTNIDRVNWYDPLIKLIIKITTFFFTDTDITVCVNTTCEKWDGDSYEKDDTHYGDFWDFSNDANNTKTTIVSIDPVEEYFKNNTDAMEDFKTRDDDPVHPDVLNVSVTISGGGIEIEEYGHTTLDDIALDNINDKVSGQDYGFVSTGRGSDAGSGGIYTGINVYSGEGDSNARAMGEGFKLFFYCGIPILFIVCVMRFISKCF